MTDTLRQIADKLVGRDQRTLDRDLAETDFEDQKQAAIASAHPQSLDAARMLGAPTDEPAVT